MFRFLLTFLALISTLIWASLAQAQCTGPSYWDSLNADTQSALTRRAAAAPYGSGTFWQATKGAATLTLAGTLHLPDPRHAALLDIAQPHLARAGLLLVEATLQDQTDMQIHLSRNPDLMLLGDGATLPDLLAPQDWKTISDAARSRGLPPFMVAKMQPWFVSLSLAIPPCAMAAMANADASGAGGLDSALMQRAAELGVPTAPLEPWQDMLALLSSGTTQDQLDALRVGVLPADVQDAFLVALMDFYFAGQSAMAWYLTDLTKNELPPESAALFDAQMAQMEQDLLNNRNAKWIPVIETAASQNAHVFVAFGAAHLFGEYGVLNLLAQNGWAVSPL